jgi:pectin methylesterase-like acyl-CoA thioesterase
MFKKISSVLLTIIVVFSVLPKINVSAAEPPTYDITVDSAYTGTPPIADTYATIGEAVAAANSGDIIFVKNGDYKEKVNIGKADLTIIGEDKVNTRLYNDENTPAGINAPPLLVSSPNFRAENITIENTFSYTGGSDQQATAVRINEADAVFVNTRIISFLLTVYIDASSGTASFYECYIAGNDIIINMINGNAAFDSCEIKARYTASKEIGDYINFNLGFDDEILFSECQFTAEPGKSDNSYKLLRTASSDGTAVFLDCYLEKNLAPDSIYGNIGSGDFTQITLLESGSTGPSAKVTNDRRQVPAEQIDDYKNKARFPEHIIPPPPPPQPEPQPETPPEETETSETSQSYSEFTPEPPKERVAKHYAAALSNAVFAPDGSVTAGLNKNGFVDSRATVAAMNDAFVYALINENDTIALSIPKGAKGMSASCARKVKAAAGGCEVDVTMFLTNGEQNVGKVKFTLTKEMKDYLPGVKINTLSTMNRFDKITETMSYNWRGLGYFKTSQKGGFGKNAEISINAEALGIVPEEEAQYCAMIYDASTGAEKLFIAEATPLEGEFVFTTSRSGEFMICR